MSFILTLPPEIRFGAGEARKAGEVAARFGKRVFLVTGGKSFESLPVAGALARLPRWSVSGEPDVATVDEGARRCRDARADAVLAVGGGSVLDAAKAAAALATHDGSVRDYLEQVGDRKVEKPPLPFVAVPTTAGSGSEATKNAVIRVPDLQVKRSLRHELLMPRVAIVDPELSGAAPRAVAASAGLDALTHLIEGYVSTGASAATDLFAMPGILRAWHALGLLAEGLSDASSRESMALAGLWGGIVLANAGLGAVHGLVAPLGGRCAIPHGAGCACLLVETLRTNYAALHSRASASPGVGRYDRIARDLGSKDFDHLLEALGALRRMLGVPSLSSFGLTPRDIRPIVAASRGGSMRFNPVELTDAELEDVVARSLAAS